MKNQDKKENPRQEDRNFQNEDIDPKTAAPKGNPYDSENLDHGSDSSSKDITEKDIEKELIENDPSEGFQTDIDKAQSSDDDSDTFEMTATEKENPVNREFEIGQLGNKEVKEDEIIRDETDTDAVHFHKPSDRKF